MKATVMWMNGGRMDGYYYVGIEGTDLRVCDNGHPCFPSKFKGNIEKPRQKAEALVRKVNKQLQKVEKLENK